MILYLNNRKHDEKPPERNLRTDGEVYCRGLQCSTIHLQMLEQLFQTKLNILDTSTEVTDLSQFDLVLSFGYRHIIPKEVLQTAKRPPINIHISYLPFNRGAHPNFWAHHDGTPHGVTIHEVNEGIDTGNIIAQKQIKFAPHEITFEATYKRLQKEAVELFASHKEEIINGTYTTKPQSGKGSFHKTSDLPKDFGGWMCNINNELQRLEKIRKIKMQQKLDLIDQIEQVRSRNNVNWMDILRVAFTHAPEEAAQIMGRINKDDGEISELLKKLSQ